VKTPLCGLLALCALSFGQQVPPATPPPQQTPDQTQSQPPPPPPPATYDPSENAFSIGVFGFLPHAHPDLLAGKQATDAVGET
jgi:hypothetical protein